MPLDGLLLNKLASEISPLVGGKISKVLEISESDYILQIRSNFKNYNLLLSASSQYYRFHLTEKKYEYPLVPKGFTMLLRKYLEGSIILSLKTIKNDRILEIKTKGLNEIGDTEYTSLILELMGKDSNIILLKNNTILDAYKKENSIESKRIIYPNAVYEPFINPIKLNPFSLKTEDIVESFNSILDSKALMNKFNGISFKTASYVMNSKSPIDTFISLLNIEPKPYTFKDNNKEDFYFTNIGYDKIKDYSSISSMLDDIYFDKALKERVKEKSSNLSLTIKSRIKRLQDKISNLNKDLIDASKADTYKLYGELLLSVSYIKEKSNSIEVLNYYDNKNITIPLDIRYSVIDNSKIYYKKYQKAKSAITHINEQIAITNDEIEYFKIIYSQIENASVTDILEIEAELVENKYIKKAETKKKRKLKTKILTYILEDGAKVYVGKNNIQNEIVTHKIAKYNDTWFHVKDAPGSHVVISKEGEMSEYDIRTCAMIASFYSTYKASSSVPVDYTLQRYIKKIPGKRACFVTFTNQKTIYIDPSKEFIDSLKSSITEY
jgi:predicted ribosome quality control (RQC) complex YloA/Tae2 family protein